MTTTKFRGHWRALAALAGAGIALTPVAADAASPGVHLKTAVEIGLPPGRGPLTTGS